MRVRGILAGLFLAASLGGTPGEGATLHLSVPSEGECLLAATRDLYVLGTLDRQGLSPSQEPLGLRVRLFRLGEAAALRTVTASVDATGLTPRGAVRVDYLKDLAARKLGNLYAPSEALSVLRWGRGREGRREWLRPFLTNPSREVAAGALQQWPPGSGLPETSDLLRLFRQEDEVLLVPLLRLVRREGMAPWMRPQLERWGRSHASAPVRVWAAAIVRDQSVR